MRNGPERGELRAAGAVLWRYGRAGVEVAIVHRPRYDDWSFPKGKAKSGEHPLVNAVREVAEETGVWPVLGRPLGSTRYLVRGRPKRVDYWAATPAPPRSPVPPRSPIPPRSAGQPGGLAGQIFPNGSAGSRAKDGFVPDGEVDKLEWLPVLEAMPRLSYEHDAAMLREFAEGPSATVPYILLRHASAGSKGDGPSDDRLRPLDDAGIGQAAELAILLACFGAARLVSSATARCVETLLPYALSADIAVTADPALTWGAGEDGVGIESAARARLAALLADHAATIVCGHGETLPKLLAQACAYVGAPVPSDAALDKAAFWVMHVPLQ